jgi:hypothetical protein
MRGLVALTLESTIPLTASFKDILESLETFLGSGPFAGDSRVTREEVKFGLVSWCKRATQAPRNQSRIWSLDRSRIRTGPVSTVRWLERNSKEAREDVSSIVSDISAGFGVYMRWFRYKIKRLVFRWF